MKQLPTNKNHRQALMQLLWQDVLNDADGYRDDTNNVRRANYDLAKVLTHGIWKIPASFGRLFWLGETARRAFVFNWPFLLCGLACILTIVFNQPVASLISLLLAATSVVIACGLTVDSAKRQNQFLMQILGSGSKFTNLIDNHRLRIDQRHRSIRNWLDEFAKGPDYIAKQERDYNRYYEKDLRLCLETVVGQLSFFASLLEHASCGGIDFHPTNEEEQTILQCSQQVSEQSAIVLEARGLLQTLETQRKEKEIADRQEQESEQVERQVELLTNINKMREHLEAVPEC